MRRLICIITVCFMIVTMFSGCAILQKLGLQDDNDELHPASSIAIGEDEAKKLSDKVPIHLYFANEENSKLKLEVQYIPVSEASKSVNNLANTIVERLIKGPEAKTGYTATIPQGTKLRSRVKIDTATGVATVDFSREFVDKHPGGKLAEQMTIFSVVNSLTELKEIQKVKFLVAGKAKQEFKGNYQFNVPFPRTPSLIMRVPPTPATETPKDSKDKKTPGKDATKDTINDESGDGENVDVDASESGDMENVDYEGNADEVLE